MNLNELLWGLVLRRMTISQLERLRDVAARKERGESREDDRQTVDAILGAGDGSDCACGHCAALHGAQGACLVPGCECGGYARQPGENPV